MDYLYALQNLRENAPEAVNLFFLLISELVLKGGLVVAAVIFWCYSKRQGGRLLLGFASAYSANQLIKNIACVPRPWLRDSRLHVYEKAAASATGYSFPSGHTVTAASIFGGIAASPEQKKHRKKTVAGMSLLVLLTAFSRNWLGAHTAQDVIVAVILGGIAVACSLIVSFWLEKSPRKDTALAVTGILLSAALLAFLCLKPYSASDDVYAMLTDCFSACGLASGAFLGWWVERHFICMKDVSSASARLLRAIIGILVDFAVYATFGKIFSFAGEHLSHLIKYFSVMLCTFVVCPLLFNLLTVSAD